MPTQKPRFMVTVSDEMYDQINTYRFQYQFKTQTQAVNDLVERGLKALGFSETETGQPAEVGELTADEERFVWLYGQLGDGGQALIDGWMLLSPSSRRILLAVVQALLQEQ